MAFFLFLLVNATLFLRPAEIMPELEGQPIYQVMILACLFFALPEIVTYFSRFSLTSQPITLCVLGMLPACLLAHLFAFRTDEAARAGLELGKAIVYFILAVSLLSSTQRLRIFVGWLLVCGLMLTALTVLQYYEVIELPSFTKLLEMERDRRTGELQALYRLQGSGLFHDPNEIGAILAALIPLCLFALTDRRALFKPLWLGELMLCGFALYLTRSRGAFMAFLGGLGVMTVAHFGGRRASFVALLGLPLLFLLFGGRQTELSTGVGTGQTRIQLWSIWFEKFREAPLVGNGMPVEDEMDDARTRWEKKGHLAHNSYLQAFADMGLLGGPLFLSAMFLGVWSLWRIRGSQTRILDPDVRRLHPFVLGCFAAYAVGLLSLSLCYSVPTYLMLALAAVVPRLSPTHPPVTPPRLDLQLLGRLARLTVLFLAGTYFFIRLFVAW